MTSNPSRFSGVPLRCTLLVLAFLALAGTNAAAAAPSYSSSTPAKPSAAELHPACAVVPVAALDVVSQNRRSRAIQIAAVCMALALFIIIWRRT